MLALQITNLKTFMNDLLAGDLFDIFLLEKASITTAATYTIDGRLNMDFFSADDLEQNPLTYEFATWRDMKSICFQLIKGKRTPLHFQFVLQLMPKHIISILEKANASVSPNLVKAFIVTIRYDGSRATLYTGTSLTTFLPDREPEQLWDAAFKQYLHKKEISCEEL